HTGGWSLGIVTSPDILNEGVAGCGGGSPSGIGFNLCGGSEEDRFPDDTWKAPDGTWLPPGGLSDDQGFYILAEDGSEIRLDDNSNPITDTGRPYLILSDPPLSEGGTAQEEGIEGDLADCDYVSQLWEPEVGPAYPFAPDYVLEVDENGNFIDPDPLDPAEVPAPSLELGDGRLAGACTVVAMPERTSQAHYDFIYNGAVAGAGYGWGGQSAAGMMPAFGALLPPDYIQAVVDYERGL
ncbi:MAG: hypothetical protein OEV40_07515, partial [Acidimicrobiia bacterium]|nr:hypothetical protein [Acidimicrobiia bacterium]